MKKLPLKDCFTLDSTSRHPERKFTLGILARLFMYNPGYRAVVYYRIATYLKGVTTPRHLTNFIGQLILVRLSRIPGIELNSGIIGRGLLIPHPHDMVVGRGEVLGDNITIYNGVTIGAKVLLKNDKNKTDDQRYPTIETGVTIFTGAKILGNITIGKNSVVAANAVVLNSFPENSTIVGAPARAINKNAL